jgi:hypothetical protein
VQIRKARQTGEPIPFREVNGGNPSSSEGALRQHANNTKGHTPYRSCFCLSLLIRYDG